MLNKLKNEKNLLKNYLILKVKVWIKLIYKNSLVLKKNLILKKSNKNLYQKIKILLILLLISKIWPKWI